MKPEFEQLPIAVHLYIHDLERVIALYEQALNRIAENNAPSVTAIARYVDKVLKQGHAIVPLEEE